MGGHFRFRFSFLVTKFMMVLKHKEVNAWLNSISHEAMLQSSDSLLAAILGISVFDRRSKKRNDKEQNPGGITRRLFVEACGTNLPGPVEVLYS